MEFKSIEQVKEYYEKEIRRIKYIMRFQTIALVIGAIYIWASAFWG